MTEETIFAAALEKQDLVARATFLQEACGGDAALRQRVKRLLAFHQGADHFLQQPALRQMAAGPADSSTRLLEQVREAGSFPHPPPGCAEAAGLGAEATWGKGATDEAATVLKLLEPARRAGALGRLKHYEVLEVLGHGGFGTVLKVFDDRLHRVVAIKVLAPELAASGSARQRFLREARAAAAVRHDHVIGIHVVDEEPIPHLVMEYVDGPTLQQKLDRVGPLALKEILRIGMQIAEGLAAAHKQGLIHRDIKPSNILLENGVERVKISDFGLARALNDASLTQFGQIAGTPQYMSPEQAAGKHLDQRSDLFSLGSVLYALCTGRPPFRADSTMAVLRCVCEDTPPPICDTNREVPDWLADLIERLQAKQPAERFQSAREVADLLAKYLSELQGSGAVAVTTAARGQQLGRSAAAGLPVGATTHATPRARKRLFAVLSTGLLLAAAALAVLLVVRPWTARQGTASAPHPVPNLPGKQANPLDRLRPSAFPPAPLAPAGGDNRGDTPPELVAVLGDRRFTFPHATAVSWMAHTADGRLLAVPWNNTVALFDTDTGRLLRTVGAVDRPTQVAFSPDGQRLVLGGHGAADNLAVWDCATGQRVFELPGNADAVFTVAWSPNGKRIASGSKDGKLKIWDAATGQEVGSRDDLEWVQQVAFSGDSSRIAVGTHAGGLTICETETLKEVLAGVQHTDPVCAIVFSPDGKWLATGSDGEFKLWAADTLKEQRTLTTPAGWLAFTPDSKTLFAACNWHRGVPGPHTVTRWDVATGTQQPTLTLKSEGDWGIYHLSRDGKRLFATGSVSASFLPEYDANTGQEPFPRQGHVGAVHAVAISPDGRTLASAGADHTVRLWDLAGWSADAVQPPVRVLKRHTDVVWTLAFSRDGKTLASGSGDATLVLWDVATGQAGPTLTGYTGDSATLAISPDGQIVAAGSNDGAVLLWESATGKQQHLGNRQPDQPVRAVAFSPDGTRLASGGKDQAVQLWEPATGRHLGTLEVSGELVRVAFSPDGKRLAAGSASAETMLRLWDVETKQELLAVEGPGPLGDLAFQPGGTLLATGSTNGVVQFWQPTAQGPQPRTIGPGPFGDNVNGLAFTPDGRYLAVAGGDGAITILRVSEPALP